MLHTRFYRGKHLYIHVDINTVLWIINTQVKTKKHQLFSSYSYLIIMTSVENIFNNIIRKYYNRESKNI